MAGIPPHFKCKWNVISRTRRAVQPGDIKSIIKPTKDKHHLSPFGMVTAFLFLEILDGTVARGWPICLARNLVENL